VVERPAIQMYAHTVSTRNMEPAVTEEQGECLVSRTAVSALTDQLRAEYAGSATPAWRRLGASAVLGRRLGATPDPRGRARSHVRDVGHHLRDPEDSALLGPRESGEPGRQAALCA
jgi:hypothetical protein